MKDRCIKAVSDAAGRDLTKQETEQIEARIVKHKKFLALRDRQAYLQMPEDMRLVEAAKAAAKEIIEEAAKKKQRLERTIVANDRIQNYLAEQKAAGMNGMDAMERYLAWYADFKNKGQSLESLLQAVTADYTRQLVSLFEGIGPKAMGMMLNKAGTKALIYELFEVDSSTLGNPAISKMAKQVSGKWLEVTDAMREHYNRLGGDVGKLRSWRLPQVHDQLKVAKGGFEVWYADVMRFGLDTSSYIRPDGNLMSPTELKEALREAWVSIATGGANDVEPGKVRGNAMRAKRHAESRYIHFKDPDGYLGYQDKYGTGDAYSVMMGHIRTMSRDIATIDKMGPNSDLMFDTWLDRLVTQAKLEAPEKGQYGKIDNRAAQLQNLYDYLTGRTMPVANRALANGFDTLRSWMVATKLGSAFISSLPDNATMRLTAAVNNIPQMSLTKNQALFNPANATGMRQARLAGLSLDTLLGEINRWGADEFGVRWSGKLANLTMRVSGLNAVTEARRRAFGVSMMGSIGSTVKRYAKLDDIKTIDKKVLTGYGVDTQTFMIWKMAEQEDWGNGNDTMLTPESIYRIPNEKLMMYGEAVELKQHAALKLLGMTLDETNMAVMMPDARQRAWLANFRKGTWGGEIVHSFMVFKGMPIAIARKNFSRGVYGADTPAGKAAYLATFVATTTLLGAVAQQIYEMINGRDPKDMTTAMFWGQAFLKGGSLGVYGDFLFQTNSSYGNTPLAVLSGPMAGYAEDLISLTQGSVIRAAQGKETRFGPEVIRMLKNNTPLQNLWYTRAVTDRLIFNNLQEMVSPGYVRRTEQRLRRDYGQDFWWKMNEAAPARAPNLQRLVGER